jgi:Arc/MetJ family transcription regulator
VTNDLPLPWLRRGNTPCEVYDWCMARIRTNIELDAEVLRVIQQRYGLRTKTEAVDLALRHLAGQPMSRDEVLAMRGAQAIGEVPPDSAPDVA